MPIRIAVDSQGNDGKKGALPIIQGAYDALQQNQELEVVLVGPGELLAEQITSLGLKDNQLYICHAPTVITMKDVLSKAMLKDTSSSMSVALEHVINGSARACISCGNTSALVALSRSRLNPILKGLKPVLTTHMPTVSGVATIADVGANITCDKFDMRDCAIMARLYEQLVLGVESPKVGIVSNGTEPNKGTELTRAAHALFEQEIPGYIGYVEPNALLLQGHAHVGIGDGWAMNLVLKAMEGMAKFVGLNVKQILKENLEPAVVADLMGKMMLKIYPANYAHAYLLGVDRLVLKVHGDCEDPIVFASAILSAQRAAKNDLVGQIRTGLPERLAA
ncbi:MAG: hypothetical protein Q7S37_04255 [bacterium]|nr:hypothetical protein [bacterium]